MDIVIVGGGIGGLTLALAVHACGRAGRIRVFEAAPEIHPLGVGINLGPHAVKELSALGLQEALAAVACQPQDYAFFTRHGQLVYREPWGWRPATSGRTSRSTALTCTRCCSTPCVSGWAPTTSSPAIAA